MKSTWTSATSDAEDAIANAPSVPDFVWSGRAKEYQVTAETFISLGGKLVQGPDHETYMANMHQGGFQLHIRDGDLVIPVCMQGVNRSQIMHVVLSCLRDASGNAFNVGLPHGAFGGFDPPMDRDIGEYMHDEIRSAETDLGLRKSGHAAFREAFGITKSARLGENLCLAYSRDLTYVQDDKDVKALTALEHRTAQNRDMSNLIFNNLELYKKGKRVIFITFVNTGYEVMRRLIESADDYDLRRVVIVNLPWNDPVKESKSYDFNVGAMIETFIQYASMFRLASYATYERASRSRSGSGGGGGGGGGGSAAAFERSLSTSGGRRRRARASEWMQLVRAVHTKRAALTPSAQLIDSLLEASQIYRRP